MRGRVGIPMGGLGEINREGGAQTLKSVVDCYRQ